MRPARGMTLLEVLVAVAVLATGVVALQHLVADSIATVATEQRLTRALVLARTLLAEAALAPPEEGHVAGDLDARTGDGLGFRFERDVRATPHPGLREVRVRVYWDPQDRAACELVEWLRVPIM